MFVTAAIVCLYAVVDCWLFWLICRLTAERCPTCSSGWRTELMGEWDRQEDWKCHACGHWWNCKA